MCRKIKNTRLTASVLCAYVVVTWLSLSMAGAQLIDRIVVVVNDDIILMSGLDQVLSRVKAALEEQGYPKAEQNRILQSQRGKALEQLIYDKLSDQQVRRRNLNVQDAAVEATIARIRSANKLTEEELRRALELDGMTYEAYRKQIKEKMLRAQLVNREVKSKIVITDIDIIIDAIKIIGTEIITVTIIGQRSAIYNSMITISTFIFSITFKWIICD